MSKQPKNILTNWFKTGKFPTQNQFWDWMDSYYHKDEKVPASQVEDLQALLNGKMDKTEAVAPEQMEVWDVFKTYIYNTDRELYVTYANAGSTEEQYQTEGIYRLKQNALAGESPESTPAKWAYQGSFMGSILKDEVLGLREELDAIKDSVQNTSMQTAIQPLLGESPGVYTIDLSEPVMYTCSLDQEVGSLTFNLNFPADAAQFSREVMVLIDNRGNNSPVHTINFTGGIWQWALGNEPAGGMAADSQVALYVTNTSANEVEANWVVKT